MPRPLLPRSLAAFVTTLCLASTAATQQLTDPLGVEVEQLKQTTARLAKLPAGENEGELDLPFAALCWRTLGLAGQGATLRMPPHKDELRALVVEMRHRQDANTGAFSLRIPARQRSEQLLGTFTATRMHLESVYKLMQATAQRGLDGTFRQFEGEQAAPASADETALLAMLAATLGEKNVQADLAALRPRVAALAEAGAKHLDPKASRRDAAIERAVQVLLGAKLPADETLAHLWPGDLAADPLHTFVAAFVVRDLAMPVREAQRDAAMALLQRRRDDGLWPASGGYDAETTSAMLCAAIGMLHRVKPSDRLGGQGPMDAVVPFPGGGRELR
ncbi:MAG: hypothetical protein R3F29_10305 [Planctomycetota bacterium]